MGARTAEPPCCFASCFPRTAVQAFDAGELGAWVHLMRRMRARGSLPEALAARLDGVGFAWHVDGISAKWYHNLHTLRRYKVGSLC